MPAVITSSSDLPTEWKTFRRYITNQPREDIKEQLKELSTNSMMQTMFPNLSILANVCLTIPVGTAYRVENLSAIYHQSTKGRYQGAVKGVVY